MKRFKNILMVAGSEGWQNSALERAVTLAKNNKAKLKIVEVIEELPREMRLLITVMSPQELQELEIKERQNQLDQLIGPARKDGVQARTKVLIGTPFLAIIREVLRDQHDLVITTEKSKGGIKEVLFGSTAMHLMRKCPCPVWVIKMSSRKKYARILAAVDPDPSDKVKSALNARIMELSTSMARLEGSEFHVVHAWDLYIELMLSVRADVDKSDVDRLARKTRDMHKSWLTELLDQHAPEMRDDNIHLLKGRAERLIPALARRKQIDLIVMGTVCRTGIAGFFIGNTAEKVFQQIDCSVLTVKPEGFVTPVKLDEK